MFQQDCSNALGAFQVLRKSGRPEVRLCDLCMTPKAKPLMDGEWRNSTWAEMAKFPFENVHVLDEELLLG